MSLNSAIETVLQAGIDDGSVAGAAVAVINRDGVLFEGGFGKRAIGGDQPMSVDTVGWIASMTKAITGAAAMQLVEKGDLDLDSPARVWAPYLGEVQVLQGFDDSGAPIMRPPKREISLRHLLTHTAGFGYARWNEKLNRYEKSQSVPDARSGDLRGLMTPLVFDPGEQWLYSNSIDWTGKVIEGATGISLSEYFQTHIFDPLGMTDTGFKISTDMRTRLAKVHRREGDTLVATDMELKQDPPAERGGGGLYSTIRDYSKFIQMILCEGALNGHRLLKAETVRTMAQNHMGDCRVSKLPSFDPASTCDAEFFPGLPKSWGLTFMINMEDAPTGRTANSLAWAGLANSYFWIDPTRGIGGVFLSQLLPFVDERALALYLGFETAVYANLN